MVRSIPEPDIAKGSGDMNSMALTVGYGVVAVLGLVAAIFGLLALLGTSPLPLLAVALIVLGVIVFAP